MFSALKMLLPVALCMSAPLAASQESMRLCHNEDESFPWLLKHTPGFSQIMASDTAQALGIRLTFVPMRGAACLDAVAQGSVDGALSIIFLPERLQNMVFPGPAAGPADPEFRMYNNSVSLFHRKQDKMSWDGSRLQVNGVIGVRQGNFAARRLQALGAKVDSSSTSYLDLFKRLERGEVMAAAIETLEGTETLRHNFSLRSVIEVMPIPLAQEPFYTVFSRGYASRHPQLIQRFWQQQRSLRTSPDFARKVQYLVRHVD